MSNDARVYQGFAPDVFNMARAIGLREWHVDLAITVSFETYFTKNRERLIGEAERMIGAS